MTLIARLESATQGSRELDWEIQDFVTAAAGEISSHIAPHYTTSIDAALPGEEIVRVERVENATGDYYWIAYQADAVWEGKGKTEALARRIAALKARAVRDVK